jgi:hypothetical protein
LKFPKIIYFYTYLPIPILNPFVLLSKSLYCLYLKPGDSTPLAAVSFNWFSLLALEKVPPILFFSGDWNYFNISYGIVIALKLSRKLNYFFLLWLGFGDDENLYWLDLENGLI